MTDPMTDLLAHAVATGYSLTLVAAIMWITVRGPQIRERIWTRTAERDVTRIQSRRRARIEHGTTTGRTTRALHNDFDPACDHWWGDRHPEANDTTNRDLDGAFTPMTEHRCVVCRPYTDDEARTLTDSTRTDAANCPGRQSS